MRALCATQIEGDEVIQTKPTFRLTYRGHAGMVLVALLPIFTLEGCGGGGDTPAQAAPTTMSIASPAAQCSALAGTNIPKTAFALSTNGASIMTAALVPAAPASGAALPTPEYCKVTGSIAMANAADRPINFQVNLPTTWNFKSTQIGGGGLNGTVRSGDMDGTSNGYLLLPDNAVHPLAAGYTTFGGDGGVAPDGSSGMNAQGLANYGGESVKRTHDAGAYLVKAYYGVDSRRMYHLGQSKGGHEGFVAAQRYGGDYDGIVAYYPADQNQAMVLSWDRMYQASTNTPGAALNPAKQALLKSSVLATCDNLDGIADGIVSNLGGCQSKFAVNALRCPGGVDTGNTCLSDLQINTLIIAATPMQFAFPLANGVTSIGPYPVFNGGDLVATLPGYGFLDAAVIKYFIQQDPNAPTANFDYRAWQPRVQQISSLYDSTDPNIDAFKTHGGKLIIVQGTTDMLVTHVTTEQQVDRMVARYGSDLKSFVRFFEVPGFAHGGGDFNSRWDSLSALDAWVQTGNAPQNQVIVDVNAATKGRTRPLCEYPTWPKYNGSGDVNSASSFTCASS
jgi:feruloyl esterase